MVHKTITYEDYDGVERTEECWFNLNEIEVVELAMDLPDDFTESVSEAKSDMEIAEKMMEDFGRKGIMDFIKSLVLKSYGVRNGKAFIKNDKVKEEFEYSALFPAIVMDLMTSDEEASNFVNKLIPSKLAAKVAENKLNGVKPSSILETK